MVKTMRLPEPPKVKDDVQTWRKMASCHGHPLEWWFPDHGVDSRRGIKICRGCPVRNECLNYSIETTTMFGIFGGFGYKSRQQLVRRGYWPGRRLEDFVDE